MKKNRVRIILTSLVLLVILFFAVGIKGLYKGHKQNISDNESKINLKDSMGVRTYTKSRERFNRGYIYIKDSTYNNITK